MINISVWSRDLSSEYLKKVTQLGADYIDFGNSEEFPGVKENGYPVLEEVLKIKNKIKKWGLDINRVTLPNLTEKFMNDQPGAEKELNNTCKALKIFGKADIPIARQRFAGDTFPEQMRSYSAVHRGGYRARGETLKNENKLSEKQKQVDPEKWWQRFCLAFEKLVPIAEEYDIKLTIHPSDPPNINTPLGNLGLHRVIDAFPSQNVGFLYCIGTRAEEGGSSLVIDEINNYGRKGKIFMCHFRNIRGSLASAGAFEEILLDDGDMNMFKILQELDKVGFEGCLNPDHIPSLEGGYMNGLAYSVGYIKALLAALYV